MKRATRAVLVILVGVLATVGLPAPALGAGGPGGHGGSGGHASGGHGSGGHAGHGGFSGHSSSHSSGNGFGHAIGHSFGHLFGRHSKASGRDAAPPVAGAAVVRGKVVQLSAPQTVHVPAPRRMHHHPRNNFPFGDRFLLFPRGRNFGGCQPLGFQRDLFFFDNGFDCFDGGFFFDPFFISGFSGLFTGAEFEEQGWNDSLEDSANNVEANLEAEGRNAESAGSENSAPVGATREAAPGEKPKSADEVTLLLLRDGSMYGLTEYWVEDGTLYYTTTYGGRGAVTLDRIDFDKTTHLNADRGVAFVLKPKPRPQ